MSTRTYNAKNVHITLVSPILGAITLRGFAKDSMVTISRDNPAYEKKEGVDGETTRSRVNAKGGKAKIFLDQTSPSNDDLEKLADLDELSDTGIAAFQLVETGSKATDRSASAWIEKKPDNGYALASGDREWTLDTGLLEHIVGGRTDSVG